MKGTISKKLGSTDVTIQVRLYDALTGSPITGVTVTDLDIWFIRVETDEDVTLSSKADITDLTSLVVAHTANGMYEIGYGYYRLDLHDDIFAAGATSASIIIEDAASATILSKSVDFQLTYNDGNAIPDVNVTSLAGDTAMATRFMFNGGRVWCDDGGTNSTTWPYGTSTYPTDTIANAKTIADANNLNRIHLHGDFDLAAAMEHYSLVGDGHVDVADLLDINSQSVEHSTIEKLTVTGIGANATGIANVTFYDLCHLYAHTNIHGLAFNGSINGACSVLDGGIFKCRDLVCGALSACTLTLNAPAVCGIMNIKGSLTVAGMDGGTASISMARGSSLTITSSCTSGTLTINGPVGDITDNSNGTTVVITTDESDAIKISGDEAAANNLEAILDGTGGTGIKVNSIENTGTTTLTGAVALSSTLAITGASTLASLSITGQLDAGSVVIDAGMDIVGALSANSLLIDTTTTLTGAVAMPAGLTADITGTITTVTTATNAEALIGSVTSGQIVAMDSGSATIAGMLNKMASDTADGSTFDAATDSDEARAKLQRADKVIDTTETPWVVDHKDEGTETVLMSKTMKNTGGSDITSTNNVLGRLEQE